MTAATNAAKLLDTARAATQRAHKRIEALLVGAHMLIAADESTAGLAAAELLVMARIVVDDLADDVDAICAKARE